MLVSGPTTDHFLMNRDHQTDCQVPARQEVGESSPTKRNGDFLTAVSFFWTEEHGGRTDVVMDAAPRPPSRGQFKIKRGKGPICEGSTWRIG